MSDARPLAAPPQELSIEIDDAAARRFLVDLAAVGRSDRELVRDLAVRPRHGAKARAHDWAVARLVAAEQQARRAGAIQRATGA